MSPTPLCNDAATLAWLGNQAALEFHPGKGLHIVVPIVRHVSAEQLRHAATRLAEIVVDRRPTLVTAEFRMAKREGRVMLDPSRNGPGATTSDRSSPRSAPAAMTPWSMANLGPWTVWEGRLPDIS